MTNDQEPKGQSLRLAPALVPLSKNAITPPNS